MEATAALGAPISLATATMRRLGLRVPCAARAIGNSEQLRRRAERREGGGKKKREGKCRCGLAGLVGFLCLLGLCWAHLVCAVMGCNWKGPNKALAFLRKQESAEATLDGLILSHKNKNNKNWAV